MIVEAAGRDWRTAAVCATPGTDPEFFYPVDTGPAGALAVARAKRVCAGCSVRRECLADVMAAEDPAERWGVAGGLSADERAARHRAAHHPTPAPAPVPAAALTAPLQLGLWEPAGGAAA